MAVRKNRPEVPAQKDFAERPPFDPKWTNAERIINGYKPRYYKGRPKGPSRISRIGYSYREDFEPDQIAELRAGVNEFREMLETRYQQNKRNAELIDGIRKIDGQNGVE